MHKWRPSLYTYHWWKLMMVWWQEMAWWWHSPGRLIWSVPVPSLRPQGPSARPSTQDQPWMTIFDYCKYLISATWGWNRWYYLVGPHSVRGSHHRAGLPSTQDTTHDHHSGPDTQIDIGIRVLLQQGQIMNHQKFCKTVISNGLRWILQSKYVRHYSPIFARAWMCTSPS